MVSRSRYFFKRCSRLVVRLINPHHSRCGNSRVAKIATSRLSGSNANEMLGQVFRCAVPIPPPVNRGLGKGARHASKRLVQQMFSWYQKEYARGPGAMDNFLSNFCFTSSCRYRQHTSTVFNRCGNRILLVRT